MPLYASALIAVSIAVIIAPLAWLVGRAILAAMSRALEKHRYLTQVHSRAIDVGAADFAQRMKVK